MLCSCFINSTELEERTGTTYVSVSSRPPTPEAVYCPIPSQDPSHLQKYDVKDFEESHGHSNGHLSSEFAVEYSPISGYSLPPTGPDPAQSHPWFSATEVFGGRHTTLKRVAAPTETFRSPMESSTLISPQGLPPGFPQHPEWSRPPTFVGSPASDSSINTADSGYLSLSSPYSGCSPSQSPPRGDIPSAGSEPASTDTLFRLQKPAAKRPVHSSHRRRRPLRRLRRFGTDDWEKHKHAIVDLYATKGVKLQNVIKYMEERFGITATFV